MLGFWFPEKYNPNNEMSLETFTVLFSRDKGPPQARCWVRGWKAEGGVGVGLPELPVVPAGRGVKSQRCSDARRWGSGGVLLKKG